MIVTVGKSRNRTGIIGIVVVLSQIVISCISQKHSVDLIKNWASNLIWLKRYAWLAMIWAMTRAHRIRGWLENIFLLRNVITTGTDTCVFHHLIEIHNQSMLNIKRRRIVMTIQVKFIYIVSSMDVYFRGIIMKPMFVLI